MVVEACEYSTCLEEILERIEWRNLELIGRDDASRKKASQFLASILQILDLCGVCGRYVKGRFLDFVIANGYPKSGAEFSKLFFVELLLLMGDVSPFSRFSEPVAFDRFGENFPIGAAPMIDSRLESGIYFSRGHDPRDASLGVGRRKDDPQVP